MIGLLVIRGHGLRPGPKACEIDARARFQRDYLIEWFTTKGRAPDAWLALGQAYGRPVSPMHPVLQRGLLACVDRKVPLVVDNGLRLFDYADAETALALFRFFQKNRFPIVSALHNARLHDIDEGLFTAMLADRFHHERERQALTQMRAKHAGVTEAEQGSDHLGFLADESPQTDVPSRYVQLIAYRLSLAFEEQGEAPPYTVSRLVEGLNDQGLVTGANKPWTTAALRRVLNSLRGNTPEPRLLNMVARSGDRFA